MTKDELRKVMIDRRKDFRGKKRASEEIIKRLMSFAEWKNAHTVCLYTSLPNEVDTKKLFACGKTISWESADLYIVPGVAFDKQGNRLGRGKGFYDRLLAGVRAPKIALAYDMQIIDNVPTESHDIPMDLVITERGIYGKTKTS